MKTQLPKNLNRRRLRQMVGACFGLFSVHRTKARRANAGVGRMTVVSETRGIYFIPGARR